jgi:hypothetical protein
MNGVNNKVTAGKRKVDAKMITRFTNHVGELIKDGRLDEARNLLSEFNERYPAIAGHDEEVKKYMDQLIQKGK